MPRLLILKTGTTAIEIRREHGDYDRWFTDALEKHRIEFTVCDAIREPVPETTGYAGVIVTGSALSVRRPEPWMERLMEWLRGAGRLGLPVLCVCFGCQILAQARGGRVVLNPAGWEIGAVEIELTPATANDPLFEGAPSTLPVLATHEDRVESLPPGAVLLAGNRNSPVQAFRVDNHLWGLQFHPEGSKRLLASLIRLRRARLEQDTRQQGRSGDGLFDRLLADLERFDAGPGGWLLDRFVGLCRAG